MSKYYVYFRKIVDGVAVVDAKDKEEAQELAEDLDTTEIDWDGDLFDLSVVDVEKK